MSAEKCECPKSFCPIHGHERETTCFALQGLGCIATCGDRHYSEHLMYGGD